ncbi:hypothetical protein BH20ACT6_BH20ACT6_03590 [soil metagenome]
MRASTAVATLGQKHVRAELRGGRWQSPLRNVLVTHNGPLTDDQRVRAVLLGLPRGAVLGGLTAAKHDSLDGFPDDSLTVVVPGSSRRPHPWPDVRLHWSTELSELDVHPIRQPPRTRMARSLVDASSERIPLSRARAILLAGCQQGLVRPSDLRDALSRRGPCRHRGLIRESLADAESGVDSLPERDFDRLCERAGLPRPSRQRIVVRPDGRAYVDRGWDKFGVACEIHGIPHMAVSRWDADLFRQNEIVIAGDRLLVFSSFAVRHRGDQVIDQCLRMLRRHGWRD